MTRRDTVLVTGANGLIGRWLVPTLLDHGYSVIAAMRNSGQRSDAYQHWVQQHRQRRHAHVQLHIREFSLEQADQLLQTADAERVIAVYHLAAAFKWGLGRAHAHAVNVDASEVLMNRAARLPHLRRFVWIGGYRVAHKPDLSDRLLYRRLGGYEASKLIAHERMKQLATQLQLPWTALHPASVIGHSGTGEGTQAVGMAEMVLQLQQRKLPVLPGTARTTVPLVHVDFVAEFAAGVLKREDAIGQEYWLLDDSTPTLPELVERIAAHLSVRAPRLRVPVWVLKHLPAFLLPSSRETLSFIAEDRYSVDSTRALAQQMGIAHLLPLNNLEGWVDQVLNH